MSKFARLSVLLALICVFVLCLDGCKSKEPKNRGRTLHGTVDSIDLATKTVVIDWFNEKTGRSMFIPGRVTAETEIYIDGKLADLSQVKARDDVVVEGYQKGADNIAGKVNITRSSDKTIKIVKPQTTQPAAKTVKS